MTHSIDESMDNEAMYNEVMPFFIDKFAQGYNVNMLCYG